MESNSPSIIFSMLVLLMLIGIQMIEAGSVRSKNVSSVFLRGLATLTISLVCSWICGYMFTHTSGHFFLGYNSDYLTLNKVPDKEYYDWVLYSCISSLCSAIVASSMSERTHITGHLILSLFVSLLIFPASAHWIWHPQGWLSVQGCSDLGKINWIKNFN